MAGTPEKKCNEVREEDEVVVVDGQDHPQWSRKDSGVRERVFSLLPEDEEGRIHHVFLHEGEKNVLLSDEEYLEYIRDEVREYAGRELSRSKIELFKLEKRSVRLKGRIKVLEPLLDELTKDEKETIPSKPEVKKVEEGALTVESASEFLFSCLRGKTRGKIVCNGIKSLTPDGVQEIANWYGILHFPDMDVADFDECTRKIFLEGSVEAVFAGDGPVITKGEKRAFRDG